jgi:hypothetical protein
VRLVFLVDAPRDYFGSLLTEARVDALAGRVPALPASTQRDAEAFAAELGLSRSSSFADALIALTGHFRAFEESSTPPRDTGNIYLDLARGMRGICRHRVYAFVITAQALGMRARFVQNEAHAWAEVELPGAGWLRVDLGGAATGLEPRGAQDRPFYTPDVPDPLPRPEAYRRAYEEAQRAAMARSGVTPEAASSPSTAGSEATGSTDGASSESAVSEGASGLVEADPSGVSTDATGSESGDEREGLEEQGAAPVRASESQAATVSLADAPGISRTLVLEVDQRELDVLRGREVEITGTARDGDEGVPGLRVEALLRAPSGGAEWLLGVTVSRDGGAFRGVFGVPPNLPVGEYRLIVRTPGDRTHAPAQAL